MVIFDGLEVEGVGQGEVVYEEKIGLQLFVFWKVAFQPYNTNPLDPLGGYKFHLKCCEMCHVTPGDYVMEVGECVSGHMNFPTHLLHPVFHER